MDALWRPIPVRLDSSARECRAGANRAQGGQSKRKRLDPDAFLPGFSFGYLSVSSASSPPIHRYQVHIL